MFSTPSAESIPAALKEVGIHIYNINLPRSVSSGKYELLIHRDTYLNGVKSVPQVINWDELRFASGSKTQDCLNNFALVVFHPSHFVRAVLSLSGRNL